MQHHCNYSLNLLLSLALASFSALSWSGSADVVASDGSKLRYEYSGANMRLDMLDNEGNYMLLRNDRIYMVTHNNGQPLVIDANSAMSMADGMLGNNTQDMLNHELLDLKATGRKETHAGITGEVYTLRAREGNGRETETEIVLAEDPRAVALMAAIKNFSEVASRVVDKPLVQDNAVQRQLMSMNKGVLRYGQDMTVTALSNQAIDPARFELPAEPMQIPSLEGLFGQGAAAGSTEDTGTESTGAQPAINDLKKAIGNILSGE